MEVETDGSPQISPPPLGPLPSTPSKLSFCEVAGRSAGSVAQDARFVAMDGSDGANPEANPKPPNVNSSSAPEQGLPISETCLSAPPPHPVPPSASANPTLDDYIEDGFRLVSSRIKKRRRFVKSPVSDGPISDGPIVDHGHSDRQVPTPAPASTSKDRPSDFKNSFDALAMISIDTTIVDEVVPSLRDNPLYVDLGASALTGSHSIITEHSEGNPSIVPRELGNDDVFRAIVADSGVDLNSSFVPTHVPWIDMKAAPIDSPIGMSTQGEIESGDDIDTPNSISAKVNRWG
ncbi:hypothetical protein SUGI_0552260 [Cryptomeria japonica]|nr:hypothetical protein SUGI_0552260 [Cryptomeria japonica]